MKLHILILALMVLPAVFASDPIDATVRNRVTGQADFEVSWAAFDGSTDRVISCNGETTVHFENQNDQKTVSCTLADTQQMQDSKFYQIKVCLKRSGVKSCEVAIDNYVYKSECSGSDLTTCLSSGKCVFKVDRLWRGECKSCKEAGISKCGDYSGDYIDLCEKNTCGLAEKCKSEGKVCSLDCASINLCSDYPSVYCQENPCSKENCALFNGACFEDKGDLKIAVSQDGFFSVQPIFKALIFNSHPESTGCSMDWGDGTKKELSASDAETSHLYLVNGDYEVTYSCKVGDAEKSAKSSITVNSPHLAPRDKLKVIIVQVVSEGEVANRDDFENMAKLAKDAITEQLISDCPDRLEAQVLPSVCSVKVGDVEKNYEKCTELYENGVKECVNMASSDYVIALKDNDSICSCGGWAGKIVFVGMNWKNKNWVKYAIAHEMGHEIGGLLDEYYDACRCNEKIYGVKMPIDELNCLDKNLQGNYPRGTLYCAGGSRCPNFPVELCAGNINPKGNGRCLMSTPKEFGPNPSFCVHCQSVIKKRLSYILPGCTKNE
jgi:hypothetical protein